MAAWRARPTRMRFLSSLDKRNSIDDLSVGRGVRVSVLGQNCSSKRTVSSVLTGIRWLCRMIGLIKILAFRLALTDSFGFTVVERGVPVLSGISCRVPG